MNRRSFLSTGAATLAAPASLLLAGRDATAVQEDCSWSLPDITWRHPTASSRLFAPSVYRACRRTPHL